mmetsp:Transcript_13067/g.23250  ORF Transcript_13067/g.23250 Transcript_13067/m.23250 type:complete len:203 (-) Transcript_13067:319-927(-)
MLWVDKHRPNTLEKLTVHPQLTDRLSSLAQDGEIPHLLFYGPPGAGKKTRIMALLRQIFGPGVEKLRLEHRDFKTPSNATVELTTVASNYHIEMCPGDAGNNDRFVVQDIIKEIAQNNPLNLAGKGAAAEGGGGGGKGGKGAAAAEPAVVPLRFALPPEPPEEDEDAERPGTAASRGGGTPPPPSAKGGKGGKPAAGKGKKK